MRERLEGLAWPLFIAAAAGMGLVIALALSPEVRANFWTSLGEVGIELVFIVFIGGVLTQSLQERLRRNEESRQLNDYRLHLLLDLVRAYHRAKAVRRALRPVGVGIDQKALAQWQVDEIRTQLTELNAAQLAFERLRRELEVNLGLLKHRSEIAKHVSEIDEYLRCITREWESKGTTMAAKQPLRRADWPHLFAFADRGADGSTFHRGVIHHELYIERIIRTNIARDDRDREMKPEYPTYVESCGVSPLPPQATGR
jgi:hypothetical protein